MVNPWTRYFDTVRRNYYRQTGSQIPEHFIDSLKNFIYFMVAILGFLLFMFVMVVIQYG